MNKIQMVDLQGQYHRLKKEIDEAIAAVIASTAFIQGPEVTRFSQNLSAFLGGAHVITCGNGTDALQIAMMALELKPGDEVIVPAFTYVATAEVIGLLKLKPVIVDVDERTFNIDIAAAQSKIGPKTRAIVPVHLFGQCANMQGLKALVAGRDIHIIEDAAQSLGATCSMQGSNQPSGTIGTIGTTSFFPTKTLGCFGDGGAMITSDETLATRMRMIASHGQQTKYIHEIVGVNSRLDTLQAAILDVKLRHIGDFTSRRRQVAAYYDSELANLPGVEIPHRAPHSSHVFHQYTIKASDRDSLKAHLSKAGVPSMIYYPLPVHLQKAYQEFGNGPGSFPIAEKVSKSVISLPIHTEMEDDQLQFICEAVKSFYNG